MRKLVLWGHDLAEYCEMFELTQADLSSKILEVGSGPTAVNRQLTDKGGHIISCDALFGENEATLRQHSFAEFDFMVEQIKQNQSMFNWQTYGSLENFVAKRRQGVEAFLSDYESAKKEQRLVATSDYQLPFDDFAFELAVSSHFLFANIDNQDVDFHVNVIKQMCRVAKEVRIFPLIDRFANVSELLGPVLLMLQQANYGVEVKQVEYPLQQKGNAMLRVWPLQCDIK